MLFWLDTALDLTQLTLWGYFLKQLLSLKKGSATSITMWSQDLIIPILAAISVFCSQHEMSITFAYRNEFGCQIA